jgi:hypothetical protein
MRPTRNKAQGTAGPVRAAIARVLRNPDRSPVVPLVDLLQGVATSVDGDATVALDRVDLGPAVAPPAPPYIDVTLTRRWGTQVVVDDRVPDGTAVMLPTPAAPRPAPRAIGLQQVVVELLEACATDEGITALSQTPGVPGSPAMNPLSRALAHALNTHAVWIGEEHAAVRVDRAGVTVRVALPPRLQGFLDSLELNPEFYPGVRA